MQSSVISMSNGRQSNRPLLSGSRVQLYQSLKLDWSSLPCFHAYSNTSFDSPLQHQMPNIPIFPFFFPPVFSCVAVHFFFIPHELRYCSSFFIRPLPTGWPIHSCGVRHLFTIHYVLTVVRYSIVISQLSGGGIDLVWGKKNAMNEYQPLSHFLHLFHL